MIFITFSKPHTQCVFFKYNPIPHGFFLLYPPPPPYKVFFSPPHPHIFSMLDTPIQDEEDATTRCKREQGGFIDVLLLKHGNL